MPAEIAALTFHQLARPTGAPSAELFALRELALPALEPGDALLENLYLSVDPYMRQLMDGGWPLNEPLKRGRAIGRVIESRDEALPEGALVFHTGGWSTHAVVSAGQPGVRRFTAAEGVPLSTHLSVLGGTGLTAYVGIREVLGVAEGDVVFITSAAGAVGSAAGQIARLLGAATVIGSVGSERKVEHVVAKLGYDAAFDYHQGPVSEALARYAPDGLTASLDGVGGETLEAILANSADHGRVALVGAISQYNSSGDWYAPRNFGEIHHRALHVSGYHVKDYMNVRVQAEDWLAEHLRTGGLTADEQITDGFENTVAAFLGLLDGTNLGKSIVRIKA